MPHLSGNIPSFIFYGSIMSEFLRIARSTRQVEDFLPRAKKLCDRMLSQGGSKNIVLKTFRKRQATTADNWGSPSGVSVASCTTRAGR